MSLTKCWLKGPLMGTPGTPKYQPCGETSMVRPSAIAAAPRSAAVARESLASTTKSPRSNADGRPVLNGRSWCLRRWRHIQQPPVEVCCSQPGIRSWKEGIVVDLQAVIRRIGIGDDLPGILVEDENAGCQF